MVSKLAVFQVVVEALLTRVRIAKKLIYFFSIVFFGLVIVFIYMMLYKTNTYENINIVINSSKIVDDKNYSDLDKLERQEINNLIARYQNEFTNHKAELNFLFTELQKLEWIDTFTFDNIWLNTLKINIKRKVPLVIWNDKFLLSDKGLVYTMKNRQKYVNLPKAYAKDVFAKKILNALIVIRNIIAKNSVDFAIWEVAVIKMSSIEAMEINLINKRKLYKLRLMIDGQLNNLSWLLNNIAIFEQLPKVKIKLLAPKEKRLIKLDLRYSQGFSLRN